MTDREKAIVMAHTGKCMLTGDKFQIFHKYIEDILGRPVMTIDIGWLEDKIKEKSKADFIALCADEQEPCEDDAISREAGIEGLTELINNLKGVQGDMGSAVNAARELIKSLPPVTPLYDNSGWTPVSEGLPKVPDCYPVTRKLEAGSDLITSVCFFDRPNTWYNDNRRNLERNCLTDIIAWMPLPEPYKPQESEAIDADTVLEGTK